MSFQERLEAYTRDNPRPWTSRQVFYVQWLLLRTLLIDREGPYFHWNHVRRGLLLWGSCSLLLMLEVWLVMRGFSSTAVMPLSLLCAFAIMGGGGSLLLGPREQPGRFYPLVAMGLALPLEVWAVAAQGLVKAQAIFFLLGVMMAGFDLLLAGIAGFWRVPWKAGLWVHAALCFLPAAALILVPERLAPGSPGVVALCYLFLGLLGSLGFLGVLVATRIPVVPVAYVAAPPSKGSLLRKLVAPFLRR